MSLEEMQVQNAKASIYIQTPNKLCYNVKMRKKKIK